MNKDYIVTQLIAIRCQVDALLEVVLATVADTPTPAAPAAADGETAPAGCINCGETEHQQDITRGKDAGKHFCRRCGVVYVKESQ